MTVVNTLQPVLPATTRLIVFGSLPGTASLAAGQYYAHRANQFWRLMEAVVEVPLAAVPYPDRLQVLRDRGIGLWDVVHSAQRRGSLDGSIRSAVLNDVAATFGALPDLRCLAFNGKLAARTGLAWESGVPAVVLPSSSAANTMRFDAKREHWLALRAYLD